MGTLKETAEKIIQELKAKENLLKAETESKMETQVEYEQDTDKLIKKLITGEKYGAIPEKWYSLKLVDLKGYPDSWIKRMREWDGKDNPVMIVSSSNGIGKTHAAVCMTKNFIMKTAYDRINTFRELAKQNRVHCSLESFVSEYDYRYFYHESVIYFDVMDSYKSDSVSEGEVVRKYQNKPLLVIDDLFSTKDNDFARRVMLNIINHRVDWKGLPTIITTNKTMDEMMEIDPRIESRLRSKNYYFEISKETAEKIGDHRGK